MSTYRFIASLLCIAYINSITAGFLASTLVKTELSQVPIEQLTLHTPVSCYDIAAHEVKTRPVMRILQQKVSHYKRIHIDSTVIDTSFGQLFYVPLKQAWVASQYLNVGDTLLTSNNTYLIIDRIEQINETADIYELSVFEHRNFYISDQEILVHNFGFAVGIMVWYGGGIEAAIYGSVALAGLVVGGIAAFCKGRKTESQNQEQKLIPQEENDYHIQPIVGYQPPYSDTPINLIPTDSTNVQNNRSRDCSNRSADCPNSLTTQSESCTDDVMLLMGKNKNHKKPKQENNKPLSANGSPDDDDPRNNNNFYKKNSSREDNVNQHPNGKYGGASYHHQNSKGGTGKGAKSPAPIDGQAALDNSLLIKETSPRRISINKGQFVVLDRTLPASDCSPDIYHGHVRTWEELDPEMREPLQKAGWVNSKGKIIKQ